MDDDGIVARLETARDPEVAGLLRQAAACGPELADEWLAVLERACRAPLEVDLDSWALVCALYFLAEQRDRRALRPVLDLFSMPEDTLNHVWGGFRPLDGHRVFASLSHGELAPLRTLIENEHASGGARAEALVSLQCSYLLGELPRSRLLAYLARLFAGGIRRVPGPVWGEMAVLVVELRLAELRSQAENAFAAGLIPEDMLLRQELEWLADPRRECALLVGTWQARIDDAMAELKVWLP